jgi:SAM-dependent methyltransferase
MHEPMGAATFRVAAEAYDRYIGRYGPGLARALCDAAAVRPGQRALDVGCGPGALTSELVARLDVAGVAAADPSPPFVETCRARHPGVRVERAPAEELPFADGEFDATFAQLVVNFMTDPLAGVREMARVTRPGGIVAAAVWDYAGEMVLLRRFWDAAAALDPAAAAVDEGRTMPFCAADTLGDLWRDVGLDDVTVGAAVVAAGYESLDDLWRPLEAGVGPAGAYVALLQPSQRAALRGELGRRLRVADAPFRLSARAWVATGRVRDG